MKADTVRFYERVGLLAIVFAGALFMWSTPWKIPRDASVSASDGYELAGHWDGAEAPGGTFDRPNGIALAPDGDVYVVDARKRVVRLDASGTFKAEWGRTASSMSRTAPIIAW